MENKEAFLNLALDRFKLVVQAESDTRRSALDDLEFSIGNQWPQNITAQRQLDGRPCLTMNRLPQFIRQVTNEQRQQRPAIQINPIGDGADVDTAEILEGIIRHIEVNSHAEEAYDIAFDHMVRIGFGCYRVVTDWIAEETEDQEIYIVPIDNPFTVYLDPTNKRDPGWGFIIEDLLAEEFKRQFPNSRFAMGSATLHEYESVGDMPANWAQTIDGQPSIRIAEYFWIEKSKGDKGRQKRTVHWSKISGLDILDEREWPGKYLPIIKIYGDDLLVNGERHISGLVRHAKDPQRAYNYWISAATEKIALSPKAPWLVAEGQIEGYEKFYEQSNVRNMAYLPYKQVDVSGKPAPPPARQVAEAQIQGMTELLQLAEQDMQATTGLYPNNLGQQQTANESGKAVLARQKQGDINTLNYSDNAARGIEHCGTIILDLIPKVYTSARIQRIVKPDKTTLMVGLYNSNSDETEEDALSLQEDIKKVYDVGVGRYDVAVSVGPSYQAKRQEAVATQMALIQAEPSLLNITGDLLVGNMDIPQSKEISQRMKTILPPPVLQMLAQDGDKEAQQILAAGQQNNQMQQQQIAQLAEENQKLKLEKAGKVIDNEYGLQIQRMQNDLKVLVALIEAKNQQADQEAEMYRTFWIENHGAAHELALQKDQQGHEQRMGVQQIAAQQQQQQSQQMADSQSQQADQTHDFAMASQGANDGSTP